MTYQEKVMLPEDVKHYTAPTFWRLHGEKVYACVFAVLVAWAAVNETTGEGTPRVLHGQVETPRDSNLPSSTTFDCPRLHGNLWLRASIHHSGDVETRHECAYGHAPSQRFVQ